ncbi:hypothetical protein L3073_05550 [Ancylomarina sp. DW003]|nr:hypothetical protein [Ancylomarina sp. DW003]MDE5421663.1 hypothetical protein [Ancylomarina sp. DW003]
MKKSSLLLMLLVTIISCMKDDGFIESTPVPKDSPIRRTKSDIGAKNWDWTTDQVLEMYVADPVTHKSLRIEGQKTPFYNNNSDLSDYQDMHPEDGWMLVFRNFGSSTIAPVGGLPSFALYNKYSGVLRVMTYFNKDQNASFTNLLACLKLSRSSDKSSLFTFYSGPGNSPIDKHDLKVNINHTTKGYDAQHFWHSADFVLSGYDPTLKDRDVVFDYTIEGVDINRGEGGINGSVEQILSKRKVSGFWSFVDQLKSGVDTGVSFFNSAEDGIEVVNKIKTGSVGTKSAREVSHEVVSGKTKIAATTVIAAASAALGFVKGFIDSGKSQVPIKFDVDLDVKLKFTKNSSLYMMKMALNDNSQHASAIKPVQHIPWGVFNLKSAPAYQSTEYAYYSPRMGAPYKIEIEDLISVGTSDFLSNIMHNPELKNVSYAVGFVKKRYRDKPKYFTGFGYSAVNRVTEMSSSPIYYPEAKVVELAIKVTHKYNHPREGVKYISIVKTYPIKAGSWNPRVVITDDNGPDTPSNEL